MRQLCARGKERNKVTVAVARELCGFVWHIFRLMEPRMSQAAAAAPPQMKARTKKGNGVTGGGTPPPRRPANIQRPTSNVQRAITSEPETRN